MKRLVPALLPLSVLALAVALPGAARAQSPTVVLEEADCVPNNDNGLLRAMVRPEVGGTEVRLYFRWDNHVDAPFYFVEMAAEGDGDYWATPPKPIDENHQIEYYAAVVDPRGRTLGQSETAVTPVTQDCDVVLSEKERGMAENLVVGETAREQVGDMVYGFLCDGIISRLGADGVLRADSICRRCIVAWWDRPDALVPAAILLGGGVVIEASPSRP